MMNDTMNIKNLIKSHSKNDYEFLEDRYKLEREKN